MGFLSTIVNVKVKLSVKKNHVSSVILLSSLVKAVMLDWIPYCKGL